MIERLQIVGEADELLSAEVVEELHQQLPRVAELTLAAIMDEVPEYARTLTSDVAITIQSAIGLALGAFLDLLGEGGDTVVAGSPLEAARRGAYQLGRGEATVGRTADALLAAYRIGARVSWREMWTAAVASDASASVIARFAELVFAYIDELSAASVAGHSDQVTASGRLRLERREQLARALLHGAPIATLTELARLADWSPPDTLTAILVPASTVRDVAGRLDANTLNVPPDTAPVGRAAALNVLLVPDAVKTRDHLLRVVDGQSAVVGPARPWSRAQQSHELAVRAHRLLGPSAGATIDAAKHLDTLVVGADVGALRHLREASLAPLADLTPATMQRLTETLQAWLLHLGRRSDVAELLHVHPQTVRYRMTQIRDLYGDVLDDPKMVQSLVIALSLEVDDEST